MEDNFAIVLRDHTAGDPMREEVQWTNLTLAEIAGHLVQHGTPVSVTVVRQLLKPRGSVKRNAQKRQALGRDKDRDQQFQTLARLRAESEGSPNPIVSLDTKKKELIGNFSRDGQLDTLKTLRTLDHDFPSVAEGVILPHGGSDVKRNHGHINLGVSHDPSQFACDSIYRWWPRHGHLHDPSATSVLLLCDGGGSKAANRSVFKAALQGLANRMGIAIRTAPDPPYASKSNPVEHRLFPHGTRACQGVVFLSVDLEKKPREKTTTTTRLRVTVDMIAATDPTGVKTPWTSRRQKTMAIVFDDLLPKWNVIGDN